MRKDSTMTNVSGVLVIRGCNWRLPGRHGCLHKGVGSVRSVAPSTSSGERGLCWWFEDFVVFFISECFVLHLNLQYNLKVLSAYYNESIRTWPIFILFVPVFFYSSYHM